MLRAGDAPPLDYAAFLDQCRGTVSDRVYRSLEEPVSYTHLTLPTILLV